MSKKRYVVRLTKRERENLSALIRRGKGKVSALKRRHARVLLKVDQGKHGPSWTDVRIRSFRRDRGASRLRCQHTVSA